MLEELLRLYNAHPDKFCDLRPEDIRGYSHGEQSTQYLIELNTFRLAHQKEKHPAILGLIDSLSAYGGAKVSYHHLEVKVGKDVFIFANERCSQIIYILSFGSVK